MLSGTANFWILKKKHVGGKRKNKNSSRNMFSNEGHKSLDWKDDVIEQCEIASREYEM